MLDANITNLLQRKISDYFQSDLREMRDGSEKIYMDFGRRNICSPTMLHQAAALCCEHIKKRSYYINEELHKLTEQGILTVTENNKTELIEVLKDVFSKDIQAIKQIVERRPLISNFSFDPDIYFAKAISEGIQRIEVELDTLILSKKDTGLPAHTLTIYNNGVIGAVQSGHNITATVNQHIDSKKEQLLAALQYLKNKVEEESIINGNDIIETINDGINQIGQEKVNNFKLQACLMMLMTTLQTLPNLKPAVAALAEASDYYFGTSIATILR